MTTNQLITKIGRQRVLTALSNVVCSSSSGGAVDFEDIGGLPSDNAALVAYVEDTVDAAVESTRQALTDGDTISWNYANGNIGYVTISGNRSLSITNVTGIKFGILEVTQNALGNYSITLPGTSTGVKWNYAPDGVTVLSFYFNGTSYFWTSNLLADVAGNEALAWTSLTQATDSGSGTISFNNAALPNGGTATKRFGSAVGSFIYWTIPNPTSGVSAVVLQLSSANDTDYVWDAAPTHLFAMTWNGVTIFYYGTNTSTGTNTGISVNAGDIIKLERTATNDITIKKSTDGGTNFTTIVTVSGAITGSSNPYIKATNAVQGAGKSLYLVRGYNLL